MVDKVNITDRAETNCTFAVSGISQHQDIVRHVNVGDYLSLQCVGDNITVTALDYSVLGMLPRYLENVLAEAINGDPSGTLYAKVIWKSDTSLESRNVGVRCVLLDSPALPAIFSSTAHVFTVWESTVKGVTFTDTADRQENLKKAFEFSQKHSVYPILALRRHKDNAVDPNAIMIFCLADTEWLEIGYVAAKDAAEIIEFNTKQSCFYSRLLKLGKAGIFERPGTTYYATYEIVGYRISSAADLPAGFEKLE
jgi:hypothetical protein